MIKRVRDKIRQFKPLEVIPFNQWQQIMTRYNQAAEFMKGTNEAYQILVSDLQEAERIILENRVHEVREIRVISDIMQKIFVTPKEEQLNELVGQIKYIRGYLAEMQSWIDFKQQMEKLEADGKIIINRTDNEKS